MRWYFVLLRVCTVEERIETPPLKKKCTTSFGCHLLRWMSLDLPERCLGCRTMVVDGWTAWCVFCYFCGNDLFLKYFQVWKQETWIEGSSRKVSLSDQHILKVLVVSRWRPCEQCSRPLTLVSDCSRFKILDFLVYWYDSPCIILVQSFYIPCITVLFPFCDHPVPGCLWSTRFVKGTHLLMNEIDR